MASQRVLKLLKVKPVKKLELEPVEEDGDDVELYVPPKAELPPVTDEERKMWAKARANQRVDERGIPVEGWGARLKAMKKDGRLYEIDGVWHIRSME